MRSTVTMGAVCRAPNECGRLVALLGLAVVGLSMLLANSDIEQRGQVAGKRLIQFAECTNAQPSSNVTQVGKAYWHRPGCFQVGHTRTISIPGCVKFNLSTNACRGFCMSFSIPFSEDIGPPPAALGPGAAADDQMSTTTSASAPLDSLYQRLASSLGADEKQQQRREEDEALPPTLVELAHFGGAQRSPLSGTIGNLNEKSDVVSVSQCCNMMETEDVTVNLRCGLNETRRLVFKSAKTCECFFCKHV